MLLTEIQGHVHARCGGDNGRSCSSCQQSPEVCHRTEGQGSSDIASVSPHAKEPDGGGLSMLGSDVSCRGYQCRVGERCADSQNRRRHGRWNELPGERERSESCGLQEHSDTDGDASADPIG